MSNNSKNPSDINVSAFERLIKSIYSAFLFNIGEITVQGAQPSMDLDAARDTIAQLESLLLKTYGNLTEQEGAELTSYIKQAWIEFRKKMEGNTES